MKFFVFFCSEEEVFGRDWHFFCSLCKFLFWEEEKLFFNVFGFLFLGEVFLNKLFFPFFRIVFSVFLNMFSVFLFNCFFVVLFR